MRYCRPPAGRQIRGQLRRPGSPLCSNSLPQPTHGCARRQSAFAAPLRYDLDQIRLMLNPQRITLPTLPASVARDWVAPDGKARVQVLPNGDSNNDIVLRDFASAVLAIE